MSVVFNTIEAFPNGRSTGQIFALLDVDFDGGKRDAIRAELDALAQKGLVRLGRDGKWRPVTRNRLPVEARTANHGLPNEAREGAELIASPARFRVVASSEPEAMTETEADEIPEPQALLRYYRAAIRSDPRGALTQDVDTYGTTHLLLSGSGNIWPSELGEQGEIRILLETLPDAFREALMRRDANENALAVGWPISVGQQQGIPVIRPVGLLAGEWARDGDELVVRIPHGDILVNPDWIRASAKGTAWRANDLDAVFRAAEGVGISKDDFLERLKEAQASSIRGRLNGTHFASQLAPGVVGIFDALGLFLPTEATFTSGAVRDLDRIATWTTDQIAATALGPILGLESTVPFEEIPPINLGPLNAEQYDSVELAMSKPLTVVTGPPGTGKSQTIVAMAATALQAGLTVLVASKNHQALDAVQDRLANIAKDVPFTVRTLDPTRDIDKSVSDVHKEILDDVRGLSAVQDPYLDAQLVELSQRRKAAFDTVKCRRALNVELADLIERLELRPKEPDKPSGKVEKRPIAWWIRLLRLFGLFRPSPSGPVDQSGIGMNRETLELLIADRREQLASLPDPEDPHALTEQIIELARSVVSRTLMVRTVLDDNTRAWLREIRDDVELSGALDLPRETIEAVVSCRPLWLASILGTPKRIPLHEGLFDLVIFDEASQCDIGTALPLMARARRAVVVGDSRQLSFISQVGAAQDRNLMAAQGLPKRGMGRFAQGRKSLFDLAEATPGAAKIMLRDQYRSAPDIVDYISGEFYGGRLRPSANTEDLLVPEGMKPGLHWTDVRGHGGSSENGNINVNGAEIDRIVAHLQSLLLDKDYEGTVGIITPFRAQVMALEKELNARLSPSVAERADLRVATVDGFQGQERDLILFSPVVHAASPPSAITFIQRDWRRLNVAISRARAVSHVFGDLGFARSAKIKALATLAARATEPRTRRGAEAVFDSKWERLVFYALKERGLDPIPQYEIAGRRLDFAFLAKDVKLDLEIDGRRWHQDIDGNRKTDDIWRDHQMRALGWRVRRFWVDELTRNLEECLDLVERDLS